MKKITTRYEVRTHLAYTNYYFNKETNTFDDEGCYSCNEHYYSWETKEEMLRDFFTGFNAYELKNNLHADIKLCEILETWTREEVGDEWNFDSEETTVLLEFNVYDWLKNNSMIY